MYAHVYTCVHVHRHEISISKFRLETFAHSSLSNYRPDPDPLALSIQCMKMIDVYFQERSIQLIVDHRHAYCLRM